ncbi:hypothetical protein KQ944_12790 [Bacillus subtilis]|uniref:hypothetical protein n=1 Tax=Pseudochrobactrum asaccharolyticum TaxID=354351 RepID=UPI001F2F3290|nr:hypothetical protein [Pseudochrobactrum asaccharolyticum]MCF7646043.1 hypothetical protein [Pseudochrobactrum asaccharolyticum]MCF7672511.1 hypothetical protein [Bacillus subtilis]
MNNFENNIIKPSAKLNVSQKLHRAPLAAAPEIQTTLSVPHIKSDNRTLGIILKNTGGGLSRFR